MMLQGRLIEPEEARKLGLVDEVVREGEALTRAKAWIAAGGRGVQALRREDFLIPGGEVSSARGLMLWPVANAVYRKDTFDNYQARIRAVLHAVFEGLLVKSMAASLRIEARWLTHLLQDSQIVPMLRTLYYSMGALARGCGGQRDRRSNRCGVSASSVPDSWDRGLPMRPPGPASKWC